jgi:hypothetical protein
VSARLRYLALTAARTRTVLPPLAATIFVVVGTYAYRRNEAGAAFAGTALIASFLAAWFAGAILAGEPESQAEMATTATGGRGGRTVIEVALVAAVAVGLTVVCLSYPLALVAVGVPKEFDPPLQAGDIVAAAIGHLCCGMAGGAIGVLFAPPRLTRRATAIAAVLATLLVLVPLGSLGGPAAVGDALSAAPAGSVGGRVVVASLSCLVLAAGALATADRWARRSG